MNTDIWLGLLPSLKVIKANGPSNPSSTEDVRRLTKQINFTLPAGYAEYCRVFGSGIWRNYIRIYCPLENATDCDAFYESSWRIEELKDSLIYFKRTVDSGDAPISWAKMLPLLERLFDSAFVFGDTADAGIFLWDLDSYSEADQSYDIYKTSLEDYDSLAETVLVGRDFTKFILDYCLGSAPGETIPADLLEEELATGMKEFYRF